MSKVSHLVCWFWRLLGWALDASQVYLLPVPGLGPPGRSYKMICGCWLPVLCWILLEEVLLQTYGVLIDFMKVCSIAGGGLLV